MEPGNLWSALVFGAVPALLLLGLLYWLDRYEKEPARLLAVALVFGAVAAPAVAVSVQSLLDVPTSVAVQSTVPFSRLNATTPIVEEIVRGLAILVVFRLVRREVDGLLDGLVYGGAVGIGFGLSATFLAILTTPSIGVAATPSLFAAMVAGLNHLFYAGVVGLALAAARRSSTGTMLVYWILGVVAAAGFHLVHDYLPSWVATSAEDAAGGGVSALLADLPNALGLIALAVLFAWGSAREASVVAEELRDEVASGVVTADDYAAVTNPWRRSAILVRALFSEQSWRLRRRLYALEVELAFRKRRGAVGAGKVAGAEQFRRDILDTRRALEAMEAAA